MNKIILIFFSILFPTIIISQEAKQIPYKPGEKLSYIMYYGWIDGGKGILTLTEEELNGQMVYHSVLAAHSIGITDKIYRIKDSYESYFNPETELPVKSIRDIHEGNYKWYNETLFFHDEDSALSQRSGKVKVPDNCLDIISAFYRLRSILGETAEIGTVIKLESYFSDEVFPLYIRYKGIETITTKLGTYECMKFSPVVEVGRVFKTKDDMTMWFSNDNNFLPIRMKFDLFIGSLKCDLYEYENLKHLLTSKRNKK